MGMAFRAAAFAWLLLLCARALAAAPDDELRRYLGELRAASSQSYALSADPKEDELRKKIIGHVRGMDSKPPVPDQYDEVMGEAAYQFKHAEDTEQLLSSADAYHQASVIAPWLPEAYFNCGVALEKARRYEAAIRQFGYYLLAAPEAPDTREVRQRIGGLRVAAREAPNVARREYLDRLRPQLVGPYVNFVCRSAQRPDDGCTVAETAQSNWYNLQNQFNIVVDDDGIVIQHAQGAVLYRGLVGCFGSTCLTTWTDQDGRSVWGQISSGHECQGHSYANIYVSVDRPSDVPRVEDWQRFHYWNFDKQRNWC